MASRHHTSDSMWHLGECPVLKFVVLLWYSRPWNVGFRGCKAEFNITSSLFGSAPFIYMKQFSTYLTALKENVAWSMSPVAMLAQTLRKQQMRPYTACAHPDVHKSRWATGTHSGFSTHFCSPSPSHPRSQTHNQRWKRSRWKGRAERRAVPRRSRSPGGR